MNNETHGPTQWPDALSADAPGLNDRSMEEKGKPATGHVAHVTHRKAFVFSRRRTREEECRPFRTQCIGKEWIGRFATYTSHTNTHTHTHTHTPSRVRALTKQAHKNAHSAEIKCFCTTPAAGPCFFALCLRFTSGSFVCFSVTGCVRSPNASHTFFVDGMHIQQRNSDQRVRSVRAMTKELMRTTRSEEGPFVSSRTSSVSCVLCAPLSACWRWVRR